MSGVGTRPSASAALIASPPGSCAATCKALRGRSAGSDARHWRMVSTTRGSVPAGKESVPGWNGAAARSANEDARSARDAGNDFVDHQAKRKQVRAFRRLLPRQLFGSDIGGSAGDPIDPIAGLHGEAEVHDADAAPTIEHDVRRFEIAMQDPMFVGGGKTGAQLAGDVVGLLRGQAPDALAHRDESFAVDVLHRQVMPVFRLADVEYTADIWMGDRPSQPHFRRKPGERVAAHRPEVGQQLERHRLPQPEILGAVDLAHGSTSEKTDDAKTCGEHMPRREPGIADRGQGRPERVSGRAMAGQDSCRRPCLARGQRDAAEGAPER